VIEPAGPESRSTAAGPERSGRAILAIVLVAALVGGAVAAGVTYGVLRLQSRTNPQDLNLGSRVQLTEDSATDQVTAKALPAVVTVVTDERGQSYGSGFLVTTDGFVATSVAVVASSATLSVLLPGEGKRRDARIVDYDCAIGVAVLKVDGLSNLPTLSFADSSQLKVGQLVVALGGPYGDDVASRGIVAAVHRTETVAGTLPRGPNFYSDTIQTDARIGSANSGGPLLNVGGQVVGMDVAAGSTGESTFALSSNSVQPVVQQIVQSGQLQVADMGVETADLSPEDAAVRGVPVGSLVLTVAAGSPAEAAGIKAGDVITQVDDNKVDAAHPLVQLLRAHYKPSQRTVVSYSRGGSSSQVELTVRGERPVCR
jgi:S1-C subfamily serine protease